ncbi:MOS1T transposase, partial [Pseudoatta argentina]
MYVHSIEHGKVCLFSRPYDLTTTAYKFLEIGINHFWKLLRNVYKDNFISIGPLTVSIYMLNDATLERLNSSSVCMTETMLRCMFQFDGCIDVVAPTKTEALFFHDGNSGVPPRAHIPFTGPRYGVGRLWPAAASKKGCTVCNGGWPFAYVGPTGRCRMRLPWSSRGSPLPSTCAADVLAETYARVKAIRLRGGGGVKSRIDETSQSSGADIVEMRPYSSFNRGHHYILTVIDVLSKYAWALPLKSKGSETADAIVEIIRASGRCPKNLQTDMGKEFYNVDVQKILKKHDVNHYSTYSTLKASVVERFNRTLKSDIVIKIAGPAKFKVRDSTFRRMHPLRPQNQISMLLYAQRHDKVILLHDNARPHVAKPVKTYLETLKWEVLPHPPYSPVIAPSNFHLFRSMAHGLADRRFHSYEEAQKWIDSWIASKDMSFFRRGIHVLPERWEKVGSSDGQYFK